MLIIMTFLTTTSTFAQEDKVSFAMYEGIFIAGYVDNGAYLNFTDPNINATNKNSKFILGMLPSLRFKTDDRTPKDAFITPNLGFGFTCSYKILALQIPLYYNAKTTTQNGQWHMGWGVGLRLNEFINKN